MQKSENKKNKERKDTIMRGIAKNMSKSDQQYCNEIINLSDQVFSTLSNKGGVRITLREDKTDIYNCSIYLDINKESCPFFETSTLKELRNKIKSFLDFAAQFKLKGIDGIRVFLKDLQNHNTNDDVTECNKRMLSIDILMFIGAFILSKHKTEFNFDDNNSIPPTIH